MLPGDAVAGLSNTHEGSICITNLFFWGFLGFLPIFNFIFGFSGTPNLFHLFRFFIVNMSLTSSEPKFRRFFYDLNGSQSPSWRHSDIRYQFDILLRSRRVGIVIYKASKRLSTVESNLPYIRYRHGKLVPFTGSYRSICAVLAQRRYKQCRVVGVAPTKVGRLSSKSTAWTSEAVHSYLNEMFHLNKADKSVSV